jgi:hypothetical protein
MIMKKLLFLSVFLAFVLGQAIAQDYYWPLKADLKETKANLDGTNTGVTFGNDAVRGPVAEFDGNSYAKLPSFIKGNTEITIAVWFRMDEVRPWSRIYSFGHGDQVEPKDVMMVIPVNGALGEVAGFYRFTLSDPNGPWADLDLGPDLVSIETVKWYYSTVVLKTDSIILYHNDQQVFAESGFTRNISTLDDTENALGKSFWPDQLFKGGISDLRVYKKALTKAEVIALYNSTKATGTAVNEVKSTTIQPLIYSANNKIVVELNQPITNQVVSVYNISGVLITQKQVNAIQSQNFNKGVYIVKVSGEKVNYSTKVVVR